jgi:HEAT repeat protein
MVRRRAAEGLEKLGSRAKAAVPDLIRALSDSSLSVRFVACDALAATGADLRPAVPALARLLVDKDGPVRRARKLLSWVGEPAVPEVLKVLNGKDKQAKGEALTTLWLMRPAARKALPDLVKLLKNEAPEERISVAAVMASVDPQNRDAIEVLRKGLKDQRKEYRLLAAYSLTVTTAGDEAVLYLIERLQDNDFTIFEYPWVMIALERAGPRAKKAIPALEKRMDDIKQYPVSVFPAGALLAIDPSHKKARNLAISHLAEIKLDPKDLEEFRIFHINLLRRLGADAKPALPALKKAAGEPNPFIRREALKAVKAIEEKKGALKRKAAEARPSRLISTQRGTTSR